LTLLIPDLVFSAQEVLRTPVSPLQRVVILLGACAPLIAAVVAVLLNGVVSVEGLLIALTIATGGAVTLLGFMTRRPVALHRSADLILQTLDDSRADHAVLRKALEQLPQSKPDDPHVQVLHDLSKRLATRETQLNDLVNRLAAVMTAIVHQRKLPSVDGLQLPTTEDRLVVFGTYREFLRTLVRMRKRAFAVAGVLRRVPVAVVVADRRGRLQSMNVAAEQLFGRKSTASAGELLLSLFADAPFGPGNPAQLLLVERGQEVIDRLKNGEAREVFTTIRAAGGHTLLAGLKGYFGRQHIIIFRERNPKPHLMQINSKDAETVSATSSFLVHQPAVSPN
jgi:PAS domain-containing protein